MSERVWVRILVIALQTMIIEVLAMVFYALGERRGSHDLRMIGAYLVILGVMQYMIRAVWVIVKDND